VHIVVIITSLHTHTLSVQSHQILVKTAMELIPKMDFCRANVPLVQTMYDGGSVTNRTFMCVDENPCAYVYPFSLYNNPCSCLYFLMRIRCTPAADMVAFIGCANLVSARYKVVVEDAHNFGAREEVRVCVFVLYAFPTYVYT
jgi:hypothetical protein